MKNIYDIRELLKQFGTYIYIGNREADLDLMETEIKELFHLSCISKQTYQECLLTIRREKSNGSRKG
ncbi:MAG TPA: YqgQ family protein [Virgibacillus sp.]|nr:YqgQ family protein [Virgibacillus sp.]